MENDFLGKNNYPESKHDFAEINISIAANECERICLLAQVDLLEAINRSPTYKGICNNVDSELSNLQQQLKQLNQ